jgi:hypothetical protein
MRQSVRNVLALTAAMLAVAAVASAAEPTQVRNDAFNMTLPTGFGDFASQTQTATSPDGKKTEVTTWVSKSPTGEAIVVSLSKMPGKVDDPAKLFDSTRDALLKSTKGTLDNEQKLNPTTDVLSFHSASGAYLRSRLIVAGDKLYQVLYVGRSADQRENPAVAAMFDSFAINAGAVAQATSAPK